jgi:hypothetical protein
MNVRILIAVVSALVCLSLGPVTSRADQIYLYANFDDQEIDQPCRRRGAAFGEPYMIDPAAGGFVRSTPMPSPCLEIHDLSTDQIGSVYFDLIENAYIKSGNLVVMMNLWFAETPGTSIHRLQIWDNDWKVVLATLEFWEDGSVELSDLDGWIGEVAQYPIGRIFPVAISFSLDTDTYDLWLDSQLVRNDEPIQITNQGINLIVLTTGPDEDLAGRFYVDDLRVTDNPDVVPNERTTWGRVRATFRN